MKRSGCVKVIDSSLFHIMKRVPDKRRLIAELCEKNDDFRSVCCDYGRCAQALELWNQSVAENAPDRRKEYSELLGELQAEILQYLDDYKGNRAMD